jgi:hypothetical protein
MTNGIVGLAASQKLLTTSSAWPMEENDQWQHWIDHWLETADGIT